MSGEFETVVTSKLDDISERLSSIEEKLDEATSFAGSMLGEGGVMPADGLEALKSTFSSLLNPEALGGKGFGSEGVGQVTPDSMVDLVASLKTLQSRLVSVRDAAAELPKEDDLLSKDEQ